MSPINLLSILTLNVNILLFQCNKQMLKEQYLRSCNFDKTVYVCNILYECITNASLCRTQCLNNLFYNPYHLSSNKTGTRKTISKYTLYYLMFLITLTRECNTKFSPFLINLSEVKTNKSL